MSAKTTKGPTWLSRISDRKLFRVLLVSLVLLIVVGIVYLWLLDNDTVKESSSEIGYYDSTAHADEYLLLERDGKEYLLLAEGMDLTQLKRGTYEVSVCAATETEGAWYAVVVPETEEIIAEHEYTPGDQYHVVRFEVSDSLEHLVIRTYIDVDLADSSLNSQDLVTIYGYTVSSSGKVGFFSKYEKIALLILTLLAVVVAYCAFRIYHGTLRKYFPVWLKRMVFLVVCSAGIGTVLILMVHLIPQSAIAQNVIESSELLYEEGNYPSVFDGVVGTTLDNVSDNVMINDAFIRSGDLVYDAMLVPRVSYEDMNEVESLYHYIHSEDDSYEIITYGRYWHGHLVFLIPILTFLSLSEIRALNMVLQLSAVFLLLILLWKNGGARIAFPFFVMWICLSPVTLMYSMHYSSILYVTVFICILLVCAQGRENCSALWSIFALSGILIAYLDLMTYPLVALGIPLILYLSMNYEKISSLKSCLDQSAICSLSWAVGYGGMWISKWIIATVMTGENVLLDGMEQVEFRMSHSNYEVESYSWIDTIQRCMNSFASPIVVVVLVMAILLAVCLLVYYHRRPLFPAAAAIVVVSLYPFAWYLVVMNHSAIHAFMTYRELVICAYGIISLLFLQIDWGNRRELVSLRQGA